MKYTVILLFLSLSNLIAQDLQNGLIAYYPFEGNVSDQSGDHHGTTFGALPTEDRFGSPGCAYQFDGIDDFISIPHSSDFNFDTQDAYSVSLWVQAAATQRDLTTQGTDILSKWYSDEPGAGQDGYSMVLRFGHQEADEPFVVRAYRFGGYPAGCVTIDQVASPIPVEIWQHLVFTYHPQSGFKLFVDGQLVSELPSTNIDCTTKNDAPLYLGKRGAPPHPNYFTGKLDDLRIYNRAISTEEVRLLFELPASDNCRPAVSRFFKFYPSPTNGTVYFDLSEEEFRSYSVEVTDVLGKVVYRGRHERLAPISLHTLAAGIYFFSIEDTSVAGSGYFPFVKVETGP